MALFITGVKIPGFNLKAGRIRTTKVYIRSPYKLLKIFTCLKMVNLLFRFDIVMRFAYLDVNTVCCGLHTTRVSRDEFPCSLYAGRKYVHSFTIVRRNWIHNDLIFVRAFIQWSLHTNHNNNICTQVPTCFHASFLFIHNIMRFQSTKQTRHLYIKLRWNNTSFKS